MSTAKTEKKALKTDEKLSFEKAMERLDKIVAEMESGSLPLETMISRFEEGRGLIDVCTKKLNEIEKKVEILVKKGEQTVAEPFVCENDSGEEDKNGSEGDSGSDAPF